LAQRYPPSAADGAGRADCIHFNPVKHGYVVPIGRMQASIDP